MGDKSVNILNILLPILLVVSLMAIALIKYPIIFHKGKESIVLAFAAIIVYALIWSIIKPDKFSRNAGLIVGFLFIVNISTEDFINWQTKSATIVSTLTMMFLIFVSFSIVSAIQTSRTKNILKGIKSSFISAILGTLIALCFGFLINYLFPDKIVSILKSDPGFNEFNDPKAFAFYNAFDNASNHVIIVPIVSVIMGAIGVGCRLLILSLNKGSK